MAWTFKTMLNNSSESGHPYLVPDLRRNTYSFSPLRMFIVDFLHIKYDLYYVEVGSFYAHSLKSFNHKCVLNFVTGCFSIYWDDHMDIIFAHVNMGCHIDLHILKNPGVAERNPTWSWCMSFLMWCWILLAKILLRIFASMFISDIGL